jgi:hypothetical protein
MRLMEKAIAALLQDFDPDTPPGRLLRFVAITRPAEFDTPKLHSSWKPAGRFTGNPIIMLRKMQARADQQHHIRRGTV